MSDTPRQSVTQLLSAMGEGDQQAAAELMPLVYDELRKLARARMAALRPGQTLRPTALVHEAYLRLVGAEDVHFENRAHFFAAAAQAMRNILVEQERRKRRLKRGGDRQRLTLEEEWVSGNRPDTDILALEEALTRLEQIDKPKAQVVMLRHYAGLSIEETAKALGISTATVDRYWSYARAWLHRELSKGNTPQNEDRDRD